MGGSLASGEPEIKGEYAIPNRHFFSKTVKAAMEQEAMQAFTSAESRVLGIQKDCVALTGMQENAIVVTETDLKTGTDEGVGLESGAINAVGALTGIMKISGFEATSEAFQGLGIAPKTIRGIEIEQGDAAFTRMERDDINVGTRLNVGGDGFFIMILFCSAVLLAIITIIFTNLPTGPYPWIFLICSIVLIGALCYRTMELDKSYKENLMQQSKLIAIRAIGKRFKKFMLSCQEIKSHSKDNHLPNVQLTLKKLDVCFDHFHQTYDRCINSINTVQDETVYEHEKSSFFATAKVFHEKIVQYTVDINHSIQENNMHILLTEMYKDANALKQEMQELKENCTLKNMAKKIQELSSEFESYYLDTIAKVNVSLEEHQQDRIKIEFESFIRELKMKLRELTKSIEQKKIMFKNLDSYYKQVDVKFKIVLKMIPNNSEEEYLELENLNVQVDELKNKVHKCFEDYFEEHKKISNQVEKLEDSSNDAMLLLEASNLLNKCIKDFENLNLELEKLVKVFAVTPEGRLARNVKKLAKHISSTNELHIFKLQVKMVHEDKQHNFRHFSLGECTDITIPKKIIMMVGMTGAGKSLMLNNMVNYVYGVNFSDNFRFKLIWEDEEFAERKASGDFSMSHAESMTRWVSSYALHHKVGFRVPYTLVLIDTPGFGDTRGINFDESISRSLKEFFSDKVHPIDELSSIGLVIQSSQSRLTAEQIYIFNAVLNIFGKNVTENICMLFTFADAQLPPALETVRKEKIPFNEKGIFKFNNSAVYARIDDESNAYYWKFGYNSFENFFRHIKVVPPVSLTLTKEVLKEREALHLLLDGLQRMINDGFETLQSIENITRMVIELKGTLKANGNFKVTKTVYQQSTTVVKYNITNCMVCLFTCHSPCDIDGDNKESCASMKDGKCVQCPGKCPWDTHRNGDRIYTYTKVELEETIEDMMEKFNIAMNDKGAKVKILQKLLNDYNNHKNKVFVDIHAACQAAVRLEEIALGKSILSNVDYIDRLIESERCSNRPNKANRIKQFQHFRERAVLLRDAQSNPNSLTGNISKYEETVVAEIKKMEEKLDGDIGQNVVSPPVITDNKKDNKSKIPKAFDYIHTKFQ
nr:uncharacterized protein LOC105850390 [Hydra vulgaris]XP_047145614.1 uncharacterized protein LOC105850390 [Hydra vulgaris]XP_047145615.1 uncharacterized protein LOC105850390 [Hydra vulgaris]